MLRQGERRMYKLRTIESKFVVPRVFKTRKEAEDYATDIFNLHPDELWSDTFEVIEAQDVKEEDE
jgi:hypothetical protein